MFTLSDEISLLSSFIISYFCTSCTYFSLHGSLFERALSLVVKDYLCYHLWDKYIEFESSQKQLVQLATIYISTLKFPTKKLHTYYERYFISFYDVTLIWHLHFRNYGTPVMLFSLILLPINTKGFSAAVVTLAPLVFCWWLIDIIPFSLSFDLDYLSKSNYQYDQWPGYLIVNYFLS